jgi:dihydrolipoamide dehydrogenase
VTEEVGLEKTAIKLEKGFIAVDDFMRTAEPNVYAIGDVIPGPMLAHVASAEGVLAVEHIAGKEVHPINYDLTPSATYCYPEVAAVGLTEKARSGLRRQDRHHPFSAITKAKISRRAGMIRRCRTRGTTRCWGCTWGATRHRAAAEACVALRWRSPPGAGATMPIPRFRRS